MLSPSLRLRKQKDFDAVYAGGRSLSSENVVIKIVKTDSSQTRIGIVVSARTHKLSTKRNLIKRRVRAVLSGLSPDMKPGHDVVVVVRSGLIRLPEEKLKELFILLFRRGQVLPPLR